MQHAQPQAPLLRKQFLVSAEQVSKLDRLAKSRGTSAAEIVRQAIDAYDPLGAEEMEAPELMALVKERLGEAIESTHRANHRVAEALSVLDKGAER